MKSIRTLASILFFSIPMISCASKLPNKLEDNKPRGEGLVEIDLSTILFDDYSTGEKVNLKSYMQANNREFLLITFGSKGCAACKEKSAKLTENVIGKHPLYQAASTESFEIKGVFTDPGGKRAVARYLLEYPYINWNDPGGDMLLKLLPEGATFSVPLTVFVTLQKNKEGVVFAIPPDESVTVEEIMARVMEAMGADAKPRTDGSGDDGGSGGSGDGGDGGEDGGDDGDGSVVPASPLELAMPGRFKSLEGIDCAGDKTNLDQMFGKAERRVLHVMKQCDGPCEKNLAVLAGIKKQCDAGGFQKSCAVVSMTTEQMGATECRESFSLEGGHEFYADAFSSLFNWSYQQTEGPPPLYEISIPKVEGPLTFVFSSDGPLLFSREGSVNKGDLQSAIEGGPVVQDGPDFPVYDGEVAGFSELRKRQEFTVLNLWGAYPSPCGSCVEELKHWSKQDGLVDYCAARPGLCRVFAMEPNLPQNQSPATMQERFKGLLEGNEVFQGFGPLNIRVQLLLDPKPVAIPESYVERYFGYLQALKPDWLSDFRTVIYDREGKILGTYRIALEGEEDQAFEKIKQLAAAMGR